MSLVTRASTRCANLGRYKARRENEKQIAFGKHLERGALQPGSSCIMCYTVR